jgi:D-arginine dehydrogenase
MLGPRGALYIGRAEDEPAIAAFMRRFADSGVSIERLGRAALARRVPGIRDAWRHAIHEPACADIDVAALHQHYLRRAHEGGVELRCRAPLERAEREGEGWRLALGRAGEVRARVLVNAAGAWADPVAGIAGARALGIQPLRRRRAQRRAPKAAAPARRSPPARPAGRARRSSRARP